MYPEPFQAGRLKQFVNSWREITEDTYILDLVSHAHIEFTEEPVQKIRPRQIIATVMEQKAIQLELTKLLSKKVIVKSQHCHGEFISPIFTRPKKDGTSRMILNLKRLNEHVKYRHFKMDTFETAIKLVTPNCFMASIDLKDAYYTVHIAEEHQKYLKFVWDNTLFQYTCLPNGLASAPRMFTKLMKPVYATLRERGHIILGYIDDCLLVGNTEEECNTNVKETLSLIQRCGFIYYQEKSVLQPRQTISFLGFTLDSVNMTVTLPSKKVRCL